ncbi:unnamed protein product [Paramecium pentaurelia]|uniref:Tetratricopeptide repeat protein n=1 Tax=Paramecium pentaurelia TaxID=43138 RepID=A0A8S1YD12_9CILI|nr:unnamed protein product [Paramecium pentaurelia]
MNQNSTSHYIQSKLRELNLEGKQDETFEQVNKNIENNKNNILLYRKKANLLSQLGKLQEVLHTWEQGIQNNIHDINFYQEKGIPYFTIYQLKYQGIRANGMRLLNYMILVQQKMLKMFHFIFQNVVNYLNKINLKKQLNVGIKEFKIIKTNSIKSFYTLNNGIINNEGWREIADCWGQGITYNKNDYSFYLEKVQALEQLEEYQEILECLNLGLKHNKYQLLLYRKKGEILEKMGKDQEIIDNYDQAISIMVHPGIYEEKAIALTKQQKWKEVIQFCNCDKQKLNNYFFLVKIQIQALSELNEQDQLIKLCNEFIHKNDMYIYKFKAQALFKQGLFEQVIESWDEAIKKNEKVQEFYVEKIKALNDQNRYPEAIQNCNLVINLQLDNQIEIQNWKMNILEKQSNIREALKISRIIGTIRKIYQKQI